MILLAAVERISKFTMDIAHSMAMPPLSLSTANFTKSGTYR
jgi:hypothetical protein